MDTDEIRSVVRAVLDELRPEPVAEPEPVELHPHRVKHRGKVIVTDTETVKTYDKARGSGKPAGEDDDGPYWLIKTEARRYVGPLDCPDCGRGLRSGDGSPDEMWCSRIPVTYRSTTAETGGIVACGVKE